MTFDQFIATTAGADWIASTEFDRACVALFDRIERGEKISLQAAADAVGMPIIAFAETYFEFRRGLLVYRQMQAEATASVKH